MLESPRETMIRWPPASRCLNTFVIIVIIVIACSFWSRVHFDHSVRCNQSGCVFILTIVIFVIIWFLWTLWLSWLSWSIFIHQYLHDQKREAPGPLPPWHHRQHSGLETWMKNLIIVDHVCLIITRFQEPDILWSNYHHDALRRNLPGFLGRSVLS